MPTRARDSKVLSHIMPQIGDKLSMHVATRHLIGSCDRSTKRAIHHLQLDAMLAPRAAERLALLDTTVNA